MNYCELCGGESTLKEGIHPYCLRYFMHNNGNLEETRAKLKAQEDILEIYA